MLALFLSDPIVLWNIVAFAAVVVLACGLRRLENWSRARRERIFWIAFAEGKYEGWLARHRGEEFVDQRAHPRELQRVSPIVGHGAAEESDWMMYSIVSFEEWRSEHVAKLNKELPRPGHPKVE